MRKPLTGLLSMTVHAVKDVDHAATGRLSRGPETFVVLKVEDAVKARTKSTRIDRWTDEIHQVDIDKANELELTVYDKSGPHPTPVAMLWIRISDIAEEMRRKKIEADLGGGWATADRMNNEATHGRHDSAYSLAHQPQGRDQRDSRGSTSRDVTFNVGQVPSNPADIDAWFALEPVGKIQLTLSFSKFYQRRKSTSKVTDIQQQNKLKIGGLLTLVLTVRAPSASVKKKFTSSMAINLCFNNFTTLCVALFVGTS